MEKINEDIQTLRNRIEELAAVKRVLATQDGALLLRSLRRLSGDQLPRYRQNAHELAYAAGLADAVFRLEKFASSCLEELNTQLELCEERKKIDDDLLD